MEEPNKLRQAIIDASVNGYEGLEVINPEGGTEDAVEEAKKGRWKQEDPKAFSSFIMGILS
ncbi:hypothetical protein K1719_036918, partial [Acacia pycnantha]